MHSSLRALLDQLFDFAGIYPPAELSMSDAIKEYLNRRSSADAFLQQRFACGSGRLGELLEGLESVNADGLEIAVVGPTTTDRAAWESALELCAKQLNQFESKSGNRASVGSFEIRVPNNTDIGSWMPDLRGFDGVDVFVELPWGDGQVDAISHIAEFETFGVKARTGGLSVDAYPSASDLSKFIHECCASEVPFKLTAGLHHARVGQGAAHEHGYLNVAVATAMAIAEDLSSDEIREVLECRDLTFGPDSIAAVDLEIDLEDIADGRALLAAIGTCSIEEALTDLRTLGLMGAK